MDNRQANINRFEAEMAKVTRVGVLAVIKAPGGRGTLSACK